MVRCRTLLVHAALGLMLGTAAAAEEPLQVVASFSILGDLVSEVGGDRIALTTLVGPDGDAHVYQPSPADAQAVAEADLVIVNGLAFEGWIDRLVEAAGYSGTVAVATDGVTAIATADESRQDDAHGHHHHGDQDPHAWQSVPNAQIYVSNIAAALTAADPGGAEAYAANAAAYAAELDVLDRTIRAALADLRPERRTVVTSHDAFGYFAASYDLNFIAPQGVSTETEASARDVAALITQIREQRISAVFVENISDRRLLDQIASETGAAIGGTLYSDALSGRGGPASTYVEMMLHNVAQLTSALGS